MVMSNMKSYFECLCEEIDPSIKKIIRRLNELGFLTYTSCSGLWEDHTHKDHNWESTLLNGGMSPYVGFYGEISEKFTATFLINLTEINWCVEMRKHTSGDVRVTLRLDNYWNRDSYSIKWSWIRLIKLFEKFTNNEGLKSEQKN